MEDPQVSEKYTGMLSFGSMTLAVGGLALFALLAWGWLSGQELPLWPALLVAGVNIVGAARLVHETKAKRTAMANAAQKKQNPK